MNDNPEVNLSSNLFAGQLLKIKGLPTNKVIAAYFKTNDLHPVSMINGSSGGGDFNNDFNHDFKK